MTGQMPGPRWIRTFELYGDEIYELGRRLGDARRRSGLSQRALAAEMCCSQNRVSDFELGKSDPRLSSIIRYAEALGFRVRIEFEPRGVPNGPVA